jgi:hypothetical protein
MKSIRVCTDTISEITRNNNKPKIQKKNPQMKTISKILNELRPLCRNNYKVAYEIQDMIQEFLIIICFSFSLLRLIFFLIRSFHNFAIQFLTARPFSRPSEVSGGERQLFKNKNNTVKLDSLRLPEYLGAHVGFDLHVLILLFLAYFNKYTQQYYVLEFSESTKPKPEECRRAIFFFFFLKIYFITSKSEDK